MAENLTPKLAARQLMLVLKDTKLPGGSATSKMDDKLIKGSGLRVLLAGLADYIDIEQSLAEAEGNKALIARLRGVDGKDIADLIADIAINGDLLKVKQLEEALKLRGNSLFDEINRAIKTIARDKGIELDEITGVAERTRPAGHEDRERRRDQGTWRQSLSEQTGDAPGITNEEIRRLAEQGASGVDDTAIRNSAAGGQKEFVLPPADLSEYEREENHRSYQYVGDLDESRSQARQYHHLAISIGNHFTATLGKTLSRTSTAR